jgi:uncharacterized protein (TIGR02145 family)
MNRKKFIWIFQFLIIAFLLIVPRGCKKDNNDGFGIVEYNGVDYKTVTIGTQVWMAENLKTTKYSDGSDIPYITVDTIWSAQTKGAFCWEINDEYFIDIYGGYYNFYAVTDERNLCPDGWHIPSDSEWTILENYLGGSLIAGGKMKANDLSVWLETNAGDSNSSGFTAMPGGSRFEDGGFGGFLLHADYWTATEYHDTTMAWVRELYGRSATLLVGVADKREGNSVRCVKD